MRTSHACEQVTAPRIWRSYVTSHSIWFAKLPTNDPSSDAVSAPHTTRNTCSKSWAHSDVNLDSVPCEFTGWMLGHAFQCERLEDSNRLVSTAIWYASEPDRV